MSTTILFLNLDFRSVRLEANSQIFFPLTAFREMILLPVVGKNILPSAITGLA